MRDVVVVGAGHNALVAACYLARAGLDVEVVERDTVAGGAVSTVERFPGHRVDRGSTLHLLIRHTAIVEELSLERHGLRYLDADPWAWFPTENGPVQLHRDVAATCASIERSCGPADAEGYARFARDWMPRAARLLAAFQQPPDPWHLGRSLWRFGRGSGLSGAELAGRMLQPADALLDEYFGDERLVAALAWLAAQSGPAPHQPATAPLAGWLAALHLRPPGYPIGGSGRLAEALVRRLSSDGGRLRLGDPVTRIDADGRRVTGVTTGQGRIPARAVLAGCHLSTTLQLLGDPSSVSVARRLRVGAGLGVALRLATDRLPRYPGATGDATRGMQLLVRDRAQLRRAHGDYLAGRPPADPPVLVLTPSAVDDTVAPPGRHNVTLWAQWYPYQLAGTSWPDVAEREADRLVAAVDRAAPGFADGVAARHLQTPVDLERELGLCRGNVMHLDMTVDAMFALRPLPGWAGYRAPLPGLYLTGASTHPGGGVFGASGRSAARVLLADLRRRRRRPLTRW